MKLSLAIITAIVSVASAEEAYFTLQFQPCEGSVNPGRLSFAVYNAKFTDVGQIIQRPACRVTLTGVSPGVDPNNVWCITYRGHDGGDPIFKDGLRKINVGGTLGSEPFNGIYCSPS
nr:hypothetical protein [Pyrenophora graminea]